MVEYALLLASTSFRTFVVNAGAWAAGLNWRYIGYALLGLAAFLFARWAFRSPH